MKTLKTLGIIGGWMFLAYCVWLGLIELNNYYVAQQNAYIVSILEQVRPGHYLDTCPLLLGTDQFDKCEHKHEEDSTLINARVNEVEKQYIPYLP